MGKFKNKEYSSYGFINRMPDIFILNVLWMVCSLPVFTMGASTTALYYVTLKMVKNEDENIIKSFFRSFQQNFIQASIIWLIYLVFSGILITAYNYLFKTDKFSLILIGIIVIATVIFMFCVLYTFPILARYYNPIGRTLLNSLMISIRYFKMSLVMLLVTALIGYIGIYSKIAVFIILLLGIGIFAYAASSHFIIIFENIEKLQAEWQESSEIEEAAEPGCEVIPELKDQLPKDESETKG